jgi:hypothetical protein
VQYEHKKRLPLCSILQLAFARFAVMAPPHVLSSPYLFLLLLLVRVLLCGQTCNMQLLYLGHLLVHQSNPKQKETNQNLFFQ